MLDVPLNLLDVSPKSPALSVIQDLINRGASVNYLPQRHPPVISVRSTWLVNTNSSALVSFTVADDGPARDPLVVTGTSSNPALLPNVNMVFGHNGNSFWTLGVTPVPNQTGASTLTLTATDAAGLMSNTNIALTVLGFQPLTGPLLNNTNLAVTTSGALPWFGQSIVTHDGVSAAQSGAIGDNQESWLQTSVSGPGTLSFWWKVSSETNFDWLEFYLNGVLQTNRISGEVNWQQQFVALPAGAQTLRWRYSKDPYCCAVGSDAAWLDQVDFVMASWLELVGVSTNGQCLLILHGIPGKTYNLQVSTNLVTWSSQALITATNSVMPFVDTAAGPGPRFYRLQEITSGVIWLDKPGMRGSGYQWVLHSPPGLRFELQASTNLTTWTALQVITNIVGATPCTDALATNWPKRFYRAKLIF